ncbi:hypothetical protein M942_04540 [Enterobacter ludwigii]|jgi:hypothetical protein|uniref:hypothetical protein n=1 Tax=Enterobacter ludwigii TaxID=299767 RepID=UPI0003D84544|nr:hypothetical protein [Enterobacter ludwigii]AHE72558.1 hypothetical protein M942_04540 [Enterobacter ludwigii]
MTDKNTLTIDQKIQLARMATDITAAAITQTGKVEMKHLFNPDPRKCTPATYTDAIEGIYHHLMSLVTSGQSGSF